jgi:transposase
MEDCSLETRDAFVKRMYRKGVSVKEIEDMCGMDEIDVCGIIGIEMFGVKNDG